MKMASLVAGGMGALVLAGALGVAADPMPVKESTANDGILAIVNDEVITYGDVIAQMSELLQRTKSPEPSEQDARQLRTAVLRQLIDERLILQEAKRRSLTISFEDVVKRLEDVRDQFDTREEYEAMLADAGLTEEQLKSKLRQQLTVQRAIEYQIRPKVQVTIAEIDKAAAGLATPEGPGEEVDALHLLVRVTKERSEAEARTFIEELQRRLAKGADFEALAREYSEGPNAPDGGRMGWIRHGQLLPELDAVLFALPAGQVSEPVQTKLGFHLLKTLERRTISAGDAAEARRKIELGVYQDKFSKELAAWLAELRERAYIHVVE